MRTPADRDQRARDRTQQTTTPHEHIAPRRPNSSRLTRAGYALKYSSGDTKPRPASRAAAKLGALADLLVFLIPPAHQVRVCEQVNPRDIRTVLRVAAEYQGLNEPFDLAA
jgi:hypothetical protein